MRIAIVLAGGRSSRFGADKLAAELDGAPLLAAVIDAVARVADRVIVAGPSLPAGAAERTPEIELARDAAPFEGPLAALAAVLAAVAGSQRDLAIVVGGDMPRLVPAVLQAMLDRLARVEAVDAVLLGRPGRRAVLPVALRVDPANRAVETAMESGERSLQALLDRLPHAELEEAIWQALDPARATLLDVDTTADLDRIRSA